MMKLNTKNKYYKGGRISEDSFEEIVKYFDQDLPISRYALSVTGVKNKKTIYNILGKIRLQLPVRISSQSSRLSSFDDLTDDLRSTSSIELYYEKVQRNPPIAYYIAKSQDVYFSDKIEAVSNKILQKMVKSAQKSVYLDTLGFEVVGIYNFSNKEFLSFHNDTPNCEFVKALDKIILSNYGLSNENQISQILKEALFRWNFKNQKLSDVVLEHLIAEPISV